MAEYLIQGTTLDAIADAINAKTGGSSAMTPAEMVEAIGSISGGGDTKDVNAFASGTWWPERVVIDTATVIKDRVLNYMYGCETLFIGRQAVSIGYYAITNNPNLKTLVFLASGTTVAPFISNPELLILDGSFNSVGTLGWQSCPKLSTLVLRKANSPLPLPNTNCFNNTPFKSGGTGGTIYIPKVLYDHLGDGTSLDYKAATNWSTIDSYGTITWAQIEGSIYETQYADGTPIPSE